MRLRPIWDAVSKISLCSTSNFGACFGRESARRKVTKYTARSTSPAWKTTAAELEAAAYWQKPPADAGATRTFGVVAFLQACAGMGFDWPSNPIPQFQKKLVPLLLSSGTSCSSRMDAAAAILSSSSRRNRRTPCVGAVGFADFVSRTDHLAVFGDDQRHGFSATAGLAPPDRCGPWISLTPLPPRDVMRYSARGVCFPKPFSETVSIRMERS